MALFMLVACGRTEESIRTDILYAVFGDEDVREYPIEYSGAKKTAEELARELSEVHCTDSDEADYWYEEFQNDAFWIENARGIYGEG